MTISDIAKLAGVSSAAVSRYLNGGPLSEQKRAVIQAVVEKTGYSPDTAAQTLRTGKVRQVGVIVPSISSQSVGQITSGIAAELGASRYLMLLADTELGNAGGGVLFAAGHRTGRADGTGISYSIAAQPCSRYHSAGL